MGVQVTPSDLRAAFARSRIPIYRIAAEVGVHPSRLSLVLNERVPLDEDLAQRIRSAIEACSAPP